LTAYFFDSSALAKQYHQEAGSAKVTAIFQEPERRIIVSQLTVVEIRSMLAGKVRSGTLKPMEARGVVDRFKADIASGTIEVFALNEFNFQQAEGLIAQYGFEHRLRSLDALQLALALDLRDQRITATMVAADKVLAEVAAREGLVIIDPSG